MENLQQFRAFILENEHSFSDDERNLLFPNILDDEFLQNFADGWLEHWLQERLEDCRDNGFGICNRWNFQDWLEENNENN